MSDANRILEIMALAIDTADVMDPKAPAAAALMALQRAGFAVVSIRPEGTDYVWPPISEEDIARIADPRWDEAGGPSDWRSHVAPGLKEAWGRCAESEKRSIYLWAKLQADGERVEDDDEGL